MKRVIIPALGALLLAACASGFKMENASLIKPGMTTAEVEQLVGKPRNVTIVGNRTIYAYGEANAFTGSSRGLAVMFVDGRVSDSPALSQTTR